MTEGLAAGEGFEPSQTESESGVLPLHKPAKRKSYYNAFFRFVKRNFSFFEKCQNEGAGELHRLALRNRGSSIVGNVPVRVSTVHLCLLLDLARHLNSSGLRRAARCQAVS